MTTPTPRAQCKCPRGLCDCDHAPPAPKGPDHVPMHLIGVTGLTDDDQRTADPTSGVQFAVLDSDGKRTAYGDQRYVAYGECIQDGHPDGRIQRRSVSITYGEWTDHPGPSAEAKMAAPMPGRLGDQLRKYVDPAVVAAAWAEIDGPDDDPPAPTGPEPHEVYQWAIDALAFGPYANWAANVEPDRLRCAPRELDSVRRYLIHLASEASL